MPLLSPRIDAVFKRLMGEDRFTYRVDDGKLS